LQNRPKGSFRKISDDGTVEPHANENRYGNKGSSKDDEELIERRWKHPGAVSQRKTCPKRKRQTNDVTKD